MASLLHDPRRGRGEINIAVEILSRCYTCCMGAGRREQGRRSEVEILRALEVRRADAPGQPTQPNKSVEILRGLIDLLHGLLQTYLCGKKHVAVEILSDACSGVCSGSL